MEQKIIVFFLSLLSLFVVLLSFPIIPFLIWFVSFTWWIVCANNGYGFYKKNSSLCFLYFLMTSLWVCDNNTTAAPSRPKRTLKTQHTWVITFKLQPTKEFPCSAYTSSYNIIQTFSNFVIRILWILLLFCLVFEQGKRQVWWVVCYGMAGAEVEAAMSDRSDQLLQAVCFCLVFEDKVTSWYLSYSK